MYWSVFRTTVNMSEDCQLPATDLTAVHKLLERGMESSKNCVFTPSIKDLDEAVSSF